MNRRALLAFAAVAALPAAALAAPAQSKPALTPRDEADVARVEAYLVQLRTLKARFLQVGPDGGTAQGTAWIERPGRMRFQYDPPTPLLLVAANGEGIFEDKELHQVSHFPLSSSPLGILLANNVRLEGDITVTEVARLPGQLQLTMVRTASPGDGSLTLVFADRPLALRQWSVVDAQQRETRVSLFDMERGGSFDPKLFQFVQPPTGPGGIPNGG